MIEIILTCLLLGGTYTPPPDWQLVSITTLPPAEYRPISHCYAVEKGCERARADAEKARIPRIKLTRTFKAGDKIVIPNDCTMEVKK